MPTFIQFERETDPVGDTIERLNIVQNATLNELAKSLEHVIGEVKANPHHTRAEFYDRIGSQGGHVLAFMAAARALLTTYAPELVSETIRTAGDGLTVDPQTGVVTVSEPA